MAYSSETLAHAMELLGPLGDIHSKRMFGGVGIFVDDRMFALIAGDRLFLKVDDTTRARFEEAGSEPFSYRTRKGEKAVMSYMSVPEDALDDTENIRPWAGLAMEVALRGPPPKRKRTAEK